VDRKKVDDCIFGGLLIVTIIGGLFAFLRVTYGDLAPIFIWSINCGLISLAGTAIEG